MLNIFLRNIQQDFKGFAFINGLLMLFRVVFIVYFAELLPQGSNSEIFSALWYGLRISLKTAGIILAGSWLFATLPSLLSRIWPSEKIRLFWHAAATIFFSFCFVARIPYYKVYNSSFNLMLINGLKDDRAALLETLIKEYHLWENLLLVLILSIVFVWLLRRLLQTETHEFRHPGRACLIILLLSPLLFLLLRFGGGYSYDSGIHWESAARTKIHLLNEAILDDGQALYRVYASHARMTKALTTDLQPEKLREAITVAGGRNDAPNLAAAFAKKVKQSPLKEKPSQVVFILGENNASWPFLPAYKELGLVPRQQELLHKGAGIINVVSAGNGTMPTVNALLTGLPDVGLYPNYEAVSYKEKYPAGVGNLLQELGYRTVFWYGGVSSWQELKNFALAQGFKEFYSAENIGSMAQGAWGIPDEELFKAVEKYIINHTEEKVFHFILTTSNHPPYGLPVDKMGFPRQKIEQKIPASIPKDKQTINQLGHIWYSDKTIGDFVSAVEKIKPSSLFVITGDHAERFSFSQAESVNALSAVPCIFYGKGVEKAWFNQRKSAGQGEIIPTIAELLGSEDFSYCAVLPSLLGEAEISFNQTTFALEGEKLFRNSDMNQSGLTEEKQKKFSRYRDALITISSWWIKKGGNIPQK